MKKSLLALAVLGAFAASAQAQSNVTIYGSFDGGVRHQTDVRTGTGAAAREGSRTTVGSNGTFNNNRIGFKGIEDLGGGLNAHFTLETGFNTGTGTLDNADNRLFQRTASVGIGGAWGSVDLGRQYTTAFKTIGAYDPMGYKYTGITDAVAAGLTVPTVAATGLTIGTAPRLDNSIQYTGTFGPVTARLEYSLGEVAGDSSEGSTKAVGATYAAGPLAVGGAFTTREAGGIDTDHWTIGASYKFGPARVAVGHSDTEYDAGAATADVKRTWIGASYAITPALEVTGAYYRSRLDAAADGDKDNYILSVTYALSKRTNLYAAFDTQKYDGAGLRPASIATGEDRQRGVSIGVNHLF